MDSDQRLIALALVLLALVGCGITGCVANDTYQFRKGNYCMRQLGNGWVKCDLLSLSRGL